MTNPAFLFIGLIVVAAGTFALIKFGYLVENILRKKHPTWVGHPPVVLPDPPKPRTILRSKRPLEGPKTRDGVTSHSRPGEWISFKNGPLFARFSLSEQKV